MAENKQIKESFEEILSMVNDRKLSTSDVTRSKRWNLIESYNNLKMKEKNNMLTEDEKSLLFNLEKVVR